MTETWKAQNKSTAGDRSGLQAAPSRATQMKRELAGMSFEEQQARVRPPDVGSLRLAPSLVAQFRAAPGATGPVQFAGKPGEFPDQASLDSHFEKHVTNQGDAGGTYKDAAEYEAAAIAVVANATESGTKGDNTYYWKDDTKQFVVVRGGFIRTLFVPSAGKAYYDKQLV